MSFGFGFALPAYPLRGGGGNNPFNQLGPTLDLSFVDGATNVGDLSNPNGYTLNTNFITPQYQVAAQYVVWETGVGLVDKTFSQIVTFSRTSGATWFNSAGVNVGIDFSTSSVAIGTGSKTFTLDATAGVDRSWTAGNIVRISEQATPANFMDGTVTSYTASTQTLVVNVTATGGSGTIASWRVSNWMPRFDYDPSTLAARGLLIEDARTNSLLRSAEFDNALWLAIIAKNVTPNTDTAPDGTLTADTVSDSSAAAFQGIFQNVTVAADTTTYTASIYVKKTTGGTSATFGLNFQISGGTAVVTAPRFNTDTGTVIAGTGSVQNAGSYWRFVLSVTNNGSVGNTTLTLAVYPATAAYNSGVDTPTATGSAVIWGAQIETGAFPTSYIPTTVAQVTRSADAASVNTLSPWFNATEGTLFAEVTRNYSGNFLAYPHTASLSDGTNANCIRTGYGALGSQALVPDILVSSVNQLYYQFGTFNVPTAKIALAYKTNDTQFAFNSVAQATDTSCSIPAISKLNIGSDGISGSNNWGGWIRRITYYPRRLSNAELVSITS